MKKMILTIVLAIVITVLGIGLYNATRLQHIHIQKTVTIQSDLQNVFDYVVYLKEFPKWSPFLEADPTQKITLKGKDAHVGAQYHWEGNRGKDLGFQEIKEIRNLEYIQMECDIQKPFKAQPTFEYVFQKQGNSVKVTQDFHLKSGFMDAFFMGVFGAKGQMEKMNSRGLELLKTVCEK